MTVNSLVHLNLFHSGLIPQAMANWYFPKKNNRLLFYVKNKKNISKCSMLNFVSADILKHFHIFPRKQNLTFHANCPQMSNIYWKNKRIINMLSAENAQSANHQFSADDLFFLNNFLIFFFSGNWIWHFMYIVSTRDSLHQMSNSVAWKN